jgi:hypothetical protein
LTAERHDPDRRQEVQRLLAAAAQPAVPDLIALERVVRARISAEARVVREPGWSVWSTAALLAAALVIGVISAAWRVHAPLRTERNDPQAQYLQLIDPLTRPEIEGTS